MIGATSLLLGCKYEEIYVPEITDFVYLSDNAFTKDEVKSCLVDVFRTIDYSLSRPFSLTFLRRFSKVSGVSILLNNIVCMIEIINFFFFFDNRLVHPNILWLNTFWNCL